MMIANDGSFSNAIGDALADFNDNGGGVITSSYLHSSRSIGGRWQSENRLCLRNGSSRLGGFAMDLSNTDNPTSPLMKGVTEVATTNNHIV